MQVKIPYGQKKIDVEISEPCKILVPKKVEVRDKKKLINNSLKNPIASKSFKDFISNKESLLVIINDAARNTPTADVIEEIFPDLSAHSDIKFIIATGTHRKPTEDEMKKMFGSHYDFFKEKIFVNDAKNDSKMDYLGKSRYGYDFYINKMVTNAKNILVIGSIEPHYFAGYTGGRKAFLPGVSAYKTIEKNHSHALDPKACCLNLISNPVHEGMMEVLNFLEDKNIFSIQVILTVENKIYEVVSGNIRKSFEEGIKHTKQVFCGNTDKKANIVITVAQYPLDIDLYQSLKAIEHGKLVLEDGGIIILVSKCRTGIGNDAFYNLLSKTDSSQETIDSVEKNYKLGYHKAANLAQLNLKSQIWAVTDLDKKTIEKARIKAYSDLQLAINDAVAEISKKGKDPEIIVIPSGSLTVPNLCK